jgi:hypothetical protein
VSESKRSRVEQSFDGDDFPRIVAFSRERARCPVCAAAIGQACTMELWDPAQPGKVVRKPLLVDGKPSLHWERLHVAMFKTYVAH